MIIGDYTNDRGIKEEKVLQYIYLHLLSIRYNTHTVLPSEVERGPIIKQGVIETVFFF